MRSKFDYCRAFVIILFVTNSLVYNEITLPEKSKTVQVGEENLPLADIITENYDISLSNSKKPDGVLESTVIEGDYRHAGYFTHNEFVTLDDDGSVYVLENFDDMKSKASSTIGTSFYMDETEPQTWPDQVDTYYLLQKNVYPYTKSCMFTPAFSESTLIQGKVHVLSHIDTYYFDSLEFTLKVSLSIFNPSDGNITEIASIEEILPHGLNDWNQKVFELSLNNTYTIATGNRLKLSFEGKVDNLSAWAEVHIDSSSKGSGHYNWDIIDGIYSNSYSFGNYDQILGMQIYYKSATYPEITVSGINNSTFYYEEKNVNITVSGAISSSYRWDLDSYTPFSDFISTTLPTLEGWHYLEVRASDSFNNTIIEVSEVGYDPTESFLVLNNPTNNTIIQVSSVLDFSTYGANNITCEWDENGTEIDLLSVPSYNLTVPNIEGYHNLSVILNDTFIIEEYFYTFGIDANAPQISLLNLVNNTLQASGKLLDIQITDLSPNLEVNFKWDNNIFLPWTPSEGFIYRTYLPETEGYHNLTVTAEDQFGSLTNHLYRFNVSTDTLLIELRSMTNESWYLGGEVVEVTISGTNNTILFSWDGDSLQNGIPYLVSGQILTLEGINALPNEIETYHYLTIVVGSIDHIEYMFIFEFRIDTECPVIDSSILDYDDNRFKNTDTFTFILNDNATLTEDLFVLISIDGNTNITLSFSYQLDLSIFSDGYHNLTIYVRDIAGNTVSQFISFYIDSTAPVVTIESFEGLTALPDSSLYVPSNSTLQISITDDDPSYSSTFSWNSGVYQTFTDIIVLDYSDGFGVLIINASDSIGNERILIYELTIDSLSPDISLIFPYEYSTINAYTSLIFNVEDVSQNTINLLKFHWDVFPGFTPEIFPDSNGDFMVSLLPLYSTGELAILAIYAEDIVGNNDTYLFVFEVDITPPDPTLYTYDEESGELQNVLNLEFLKVGAEIWYDNTSIPDLSIFIYYWNDNTGEILDDTCIVTAPLEVGFHNLTIILRDKTGENTSPNEIELVLTFLLKAEGSLDILETSAHSCIYGENITIDVNFKNASLNDLVITKIVVNGTLMEFWHLSDYNYRFYYCSRLADQKGNYTLQIAVESVYYFGETNESTRFSIEVQPIPLNLSIEVSDVEIVEGGSVVVIGTLTYLNGTPVYGLEITFFIYLYYKSGRGTVDAAIEDYDDVVPLSDITGLEGKASVDYLLTEEIDHIAISASFEGSDILGSISLDFEDIVATIKTGLAPAVLYSIIGVSIFLLGLVSFIVYKITKRKPFEKYLKKFSTQDLVLKVNEICPGVILSIFDQKRGPIPLVTENSFDYDYGGRFTIGTENFLLKICDQAYSTLGFEDVHHGRKTSAINLPNEGLVGFVHAIQLENKDARGGFENLSVVLIVHADYGNYLLAYSDYLYSHIDVLISKLKSKADLAEIKTQISEIRLRTTQVVLAGIEDMK